MVDPIVTDVSHTGMAHGIDCNLRAMGEIFAGCSISERVVVGETVAYFTGIPFPLFNGTTCARFSPADADAGIAEIAREAKARGLAVIWWLTAGSTPADLFGRLTSSGFQFGEPEPGMAIDLDMLMDERLPAGLEIDRSHEDSLDIWMATLVPAYGLPGRLEDEHA